MPGSLLDPVASYHRNNIDSARSEASEASACSSEGGSSKKVSFNKAVRVKKFNHQPSATNVGLSSEPNSKLWFKVFQTNGNNSVIAADSPDSSSTKRTDSPSKDGRPLSTIIEANQDITPPPSMMSRKPVLSRSNSKTRPGWDDPQPFKGQDMAYYKATGHRSRTAESPTNRNGYGQHGGNYSGGMPPEPEVDYVDPFGHEKKEKKSLVNGVKVMFGMKDKKEKSTIDVTKINSPYSHYQPRSRSASPTKASEMSTNGYNKQTDVKEREAKSYELNSSNGRELAIRQDDSEVEDDAPVKIVPIEVWDSGHVLVGNTNNREQSNTVIPGEGRMMTTCEQRSEVWRHKTRRKYYEDTKKEKRTRDSSSADSPTNQPVGRHRKQPKALEFDAKTDDDKLITAGELDEILLDKKHTARHTSAVARTQQAQEKTYSSNDNEFFPYLDSYMPGMKDQSTQCNIPKVSKTKRFEIAQDFRVIKSSRDGSVTAYSDVPSLRVKAPNGIIGTRDKSQDVIYSQVDKNRKNGATTVMRTSHYEVNNDNPVYDPNDYLYESNATRLKSRLSSRSPSPLTRRKESPSPMLRRKAIDSPGRRPTARTLTKTNALNVGNEMGPDVRMSPKLPPSLAKKCSFEPPQEWYAVENTHLSDEQAARNRAAAYERNLARETIEETMSISNTSSDEMVNNHHGEPNDTSAMKSVVREIDLDKREISYENPSPNRHRNASSDYEGNAGNGTGLWFKSLDEDYRRGMAQSEVTFPGMNLTGDREPGPSYSTMSRVTKKPPRSVERVVPPAPHAYTLDRRYLEERRRNKASSLKQVPIVGRRDMPSPTADRSSSLNPGPMKRFNSTRDMTTNEYNEIRRGGLATAYQNRQKRASSLNRSVEPRGYDSGSQYRLAQESDPVVLYIPAVSHHNKKFDEDDRLSGIQLARSQSILSTSKRPSKYTNDKKQSKDQSRGMSANRGPAVTVHPSGLNDDEDEIVQLRDENDGGRKKIAKKDLKRSQSIPKDTKFPWLHKFGIRVKAREP